MKPYNYSNLIINKLTREKYNELCAAGDIKYEQLYFVKDDNLDAFGGRVVNVDTPTNYTDATNKGYVEDNFLKKTEVSYYINVDNTRIYSTLSTPYPQGTKSTDVSGYIHEKPDSTTMESLPFVIVSKSNNISTDITITWTDDGTPGYVFSFNGLSFKDNGISKSTDDTSINEDGYYVKASRIPNWPIIDRFVKRSEIYSELSSINSSSDFENVRSCLISLANKLQN